MSGPHVPGRSADERELGRLRDAFAADSGRPAPHDCPSPERIWEAVRGTAGAEEVRSVLDHLASCPDCSQEWRLAVAFEEEEEDTVPARPPSTLRHLRSWAAAAAVAVLALGVAGIWWSQRDPAGPGEQVAQLRGDEAAIGSLLPEDEPLPRAEPVLRWTPVAEDDGEGASYDLLVSTGDLAPVADATGLTEPRYRLPAESIADLPSGTELLWRVEATAPDGRRVSSPTFVARLE